MEEPELMAEDWALLRALLPAGWQELARQTGALKGLRKAKDEGNLLRTLLLHLACGYSLRETAVRARESRLAELSDVAVLKRLRKSKAWLHALCRQLLDEQARATRLLPAPARRLRLIDGTLIREAGPTGSHWRIHYSLRWPELTCDHFALSPAHGRGNGESLTHFPVQAGEHLLADRGYSHYASVAHVAAHGAMLTVRLSPTSLRLLDRAGQRFALQRALRRIQKPHEVGCWEVGVSGAAGQPPVAGRLCVLRKSRAAAAKAQTRARQIDTRKGYALRADTLLYAEYVLVFTTAPAAIPAREILEIYRLRWQIELVFKRLKSLAQLGHLPKADQASSQAWLYGKLFVALLTERLIQWGQTFSPWGYALAAAPAAEPLA